MTTFATQIHEVLRTVDLAASGPVVAVAQTFATSPADLWDACTRPARLARWFEPVEGDLLVGGRYRLADSGTEGTVERCEAPHALAVTWEYDGDASRVVATIEAVADGARLTIAHEGVEDEHWRELGPSAGGLGWDESLLALGLHLRGDDGSAPEALQASLATDEGDAFLAQAADAWRGAHVEAGADPSAAAAQAARALDVVRAMREG